jgi:hypothetical protein
MGARGQVKVCQIGHIHHGANNVPQSRAGLGECAGYDRQDGLCLHIGIAVQFRGTRCRPRYEDLVSDADGARLSVLVLKGVTGRDILPWQARSPLQAARGDQRQPSAGATWVKMASITCAL